MALQPKNGLSTSDDSPTSEDRFSDDQEIVVREAKLRTKVPPKYPWPSDVRCEDHGTPNVKPCRSYKAGLKLIRRLKPEYEWITIYKDKRGRNLIRQLPSLLAQLNSMFSDQLRADYSPSQLALLHEADVLLICYDSRLDTILSYGSTQFSERGTIPNIPYQVNHAGHMVVALGHEKKQLAPLTGITMALYGHTFHDLFRKEIVVMRTNNRYMERLFGVAPPLYRSDKLTGQETGDIKYVVDAIRWTDRNIFYSQPGFEFGKPTKISHRFTTDVTIDGLEIDEIVYLARISSIGFYLLRVLHSALNRTKLR